MLSRAAIAMSSMLCPVRVEQWSYPLDKAPKISIDANMTRLFVNPRWPSKEVTDKRMALSMNPSLQ